MSRPANKGFTLIELIAVIAITSLIGSVSGLLIVQTATGFVTARENAAILQNARACMSRLTREFRQIDDVIGIETAPFSFRYRMAEGTDHQLKLADGKLKIGEDILTDRVNRFELAFYQNSDPDRSLAVNNALSPPFLIEIRLELARNQGSPSAFKTRVHVP